METNIHQAYLCLHFSIRRLMFTSVQVNKTRSKPSIWLIYGWSSIWQTIFSLRHLIFSLQVRGSSAIDFNFLLSLQQNACLTCTKGKCYLAPMHFLLTLSTVALYLTQSYTNHLFTDLIVILLCVYYPIQNPSSIDFYCCSVCVYYHCFLLQAKFPPLGQ